MLIIMSGAATRRQIEHVIACARNEGLHPHLSREAERVALACLGTVADAAAGQRLEQLDGVVRVERFATPYKLASRAYRREDSLVRLRNGVVIGGREVVLMAGPCTIESKEQVEVVARAVRRSGARVMRGGAFKPRTSPYSFQGMGEVGLRLLRDAADREGLAVVSEVVDASHLSLMCEYVDLLQIGARNMQNFELLKQVGRARHPVVLKRGMSATIEELLLAAEYLLSAGNSQVILCERGIRTFERATRNTLDLSAVAVAKSLSHLPIIVDPSHATGLRDKVPPMARAAVAAGADGLLVEVHDQPERALCDGAQSLLPAQLVELADDLTRVAAAVGRCFEGPDVHAGVQTKEMM